MKILVIGDVHGRTNWEQFKDKIDDIDQCIFVGDYLDSFNVAPSAILDNFKNIVNFKAKYPDKIQLLIGNHDYHYFFNTSSGYGSRYCSGFKAWMLFDYKYVFNEHKEFFDVAYSYKDHLFSHAGITTKWLEQIGIEYKDRELELIVEDVNNLVYTQKGLNDLWSVPYSRGGSIHNAGSCIWVDESEFISDGLIPGVVQVFGHTGQNGIQAVEIDNKVAYYAVDCLAYKEEFLTLNI